MNPPGDRLRAIAARWCRATTMERVIDPLLTDVQIEYRAAISQGRTWGRRWIRMAGYAAFLKVVAVCACESIASDWSRDERQSLTRTVALSAVTGIVASAVLLVVPVLRGLPADLLLYSIPQTLPLAIPVGVTVGMFWGLGGRVVSRRLKGAVLVMALACSVGSLVTIWWIVPVANQAFRVSLVDRVRLSTGREATLARGAVEMSLGEIRLRMDALTRSGRPREARNLAFAFHFRWALSFAPFVLGLFALSVMPRRPFRRWMLGVLGCGACLAYYVLLAAGDHAARGDVLPVIGAVWLPNVIFVMASVAMRLGPPGRPRAFAAQ
jgi:hypothetical protein